MKTTNPVDAARVALLLAELRLSAVKLVWADLAAQADKEGWPAARFLAALAEHEVAERARRRIERHLAEARLPPGKTIDTFDFERVPVVSKAQIMALAAGDAWLGMGANLILFGPPGTGKSHLASALGFALVEGGWRVLFTRMNRFCFGESFEDRIATGLKIVPSCQHLANMTSVRADCVPKISLGRTPTRDIARNGA